MEEKQRYTIGENLHLQDAAIALRETGNGVRVELTAFGKPGLVNNMCQTVADLEPTVIAEWPGNSPDGCTIFANTESGLIEAYASGNNPPGNDWVPIFGIEQTDEGYTVTQPFVNARHSTLTGSA